MSYMAFSLIIYNNINYVDIKNTYYENNFLLETELGTFFRAELGYFYYHYGQINFENITVVN